MSQEFILPTEKRKPQNYNPRLLILYGRPKSGKSSAVASLEDNLIIDLENGYRALEVMSVDAKSAADLYKIKAALDAKYKETGKHPYKFITIDNATRLEEMSLPVAAAKYRALPMGNNWGYLRDNKGMILKIDGKPAIDPKADVRTIPKGAGYLYLREALKDIVHMFMPYCDTLILICHVKDRQIDKNNVETVELAVDLAGKLADIICGEADAVGYVYRDGNKTMVSFQGGDSTIKEARPLHLRGRKFCIGISDENNVLHMDLSKIFMTDGSKRSKN